MSAYIVNEETITKIINGLRSEELLGKVALAAGFEGTLGAGYSYNQVGTALYAMNEAAVNARYNYGDKAPTYNHTRELPESRPALYKSLSCFIYQCCEGDVPDSELFKAMEEIKITLADRIVSDMREYRDAEWG